MGSNKQSYQEKTTTYYVTYGLKTDNSNTFAYLEACHWICSLQYFNLDETSNPKEN